jgi:hypothetical protein
MPLAGLLRHFSTLVDLDQILITLQLQCLVAAGAAVAARVRLLLGGMLY